MLEALIRAPLRWDWGDTIDRDEEGKKPWNPHHPTLLNPPKKNNLKAQNWYPYRNEYILDDPNLTRDGIITFDHDIGRIKSNPSQFRLHTRDERIHTTFEVSKER